MVRAVVFDLFETLITESETRPPGVSSLAPLFGCERDAFRCEWKAARPGVTLGRVSFAQALQQIAASLGRSASDAALVRARRQRIEAKRAAFERVERDVLLTL